MKVTIEFNLPKDKEQYDLTNKANSLHSVIWDFDQYLRSILKHGSKDFKESEHGTIEKIRKELYNIMEENDIKLN